ncbi:MAG: UDPglucose 6-dehydrogenase [Parcubacteria group bacterium Gr01-1014_66]|nr:MAG: UDPglucose 6-dehydrogenase [Parcubacteria group bacterium Gr01-1014_66]
MDVPSFSVGIVGVGMVGTPLKHYLEEEKGYQRARDLFLYDKDTKKGFLDDLASASIVFICVPTPRASDGRADISIVEMAVGSLPGKKIVVIKSTVPPGTTEQLQCIYSQHKFLFNPEFLTEKRAWEDFIKPDRQIVGFTAESLDAAHAVLSLLPKAPFMSPWGTHTYQQTRITATEAEIIKYAGNVFFARKVTYANAIASLADMHGVNYEHIRKGMAADFRIGDSHLDVVHGGYRGYGGYCFPKDTDAFIRHLEEKGLEGEAKLIQQDKIFNEELLRSQGLTAEEVSVHDHEWIKKKMENRN